MGSPEKPLSDLGKLSYRSYWSYVLLDILKDAQGTVSIKELRYVLGNALQNNDLIDDFHCLHGIKTAACPPPPFILS